MDWVKFLISAVLGLASVSKFLDSYEYSFFTTIMNCFKNTIFQVALVGSLEMPKADIWVSIAILSGLIGYCAKIYIT